MKDIKVLQDDYKRIEDKLLTLKKKVEDIFNSDNFYNEEIIHEKLAKTANQYEKISDLQEINEKEYAEVLRELIHENSPLLALAFYDIAELNIKLGKISGNLSYYTEAAVCTQYSMRVGKESDLQEQYKQLSRINGLLITACTDDQTKIIDINRESIEKFSHKVELEELRSHTKREIVKIGDDRQQKNNNYVPESRKLFSHIAQEMAQYLATLYEEAEAVLGEAPCKYTVIGLGSMALQQMTPWSDLEFAILIEEDAPKSKEYFRQLSHYVHFKIICLGETTIPFSTYKLNMDHLVPQAVNFDLGGKTPLGRAEKPYDLIGTIESIMNYTKNTDKKAEHIDKNLPNILGQVCFVHGDKQMVLEYKEQVKEFLEAQNEGNKSNAEARAIQMLTHGSVEIDYSKDIPGKEAKSKGNLEEFSFNPYEAFGKLFDVKQEIYRLPDRLIYNLGLIFSLQGDNAWHIIEKLNTNGYLSQEGAFNLQKIISFATILRLKTYSHYNCQKEKMAIRDLKQNIDSKQFKLEPDALFRLNKEDLQEDGALFEYYYSALPLLERLKEYCTKRETEELSNPISFFKEDFYQNKPSVKAKIYSRLLKWDKALACEEQNLKELRENLNQDNSKIASSLYNIGNILLKLNLYREALEVHKEALKIREALYADKHMIHFDIADSFEGIGLSYYGFEEIASKEGVCYHHRALDIRKILYGSRTNHSSIATSLDLIGSHYKSLGGIENIRKAFPYQEKAFEMRQKIYKTNHQDIAYSLNNMANCYTEFNQPKKALEYREKSLKMRLELYHDSHPSIVNILNNLVGDYSTFADGAKNHEDKLQALNQALKYAEDAYVMNKDLYGNCHNDISKSLCKKGALYELLGKLNKSLSQQQQGLELKKQGYEMKLACQEGKEDSLTAEIYNDLGNVCENLKNKDESLKYFRKALEIRWKIYKDHDSADTLYELGEAYISLGDKLGGLKYLEEALEIRKKMSNPNNSAIDMNWMRIAFLYQSIDKEKSLNFYEQLLLININYNAGLSKDNLTLIRNLIKLCEDLNLYEEGEKYCTLYNLIIEENIIEQNIVIPELLVSLKKSIESYQSLDSLRQLFISITNFEEITNENTEAAHEGEANLTNSSCLPLSGEPSTEPPSLDPPH